MLQPALRSSIEEQLCILVAQLFRAKSMLADMTPRQREDLASGLAEMSRALGNLNSAIARSEATRVREFH